MSTIYILKAKQNIMININRNKYLKIFIIFFVLFAVLTKVHVVSWNDSSRMAQIQSLVERGSFIIDKSTFSTGDKYFFNNHFYSDKPPILAICAAPFYFVLNHLGFSFENNSRLTTYIVTLLSIGSLSALGLTVFRKILEVFFKTSDEWADIVAFITGTGTLILPYSLYFNNHLPSGVFAIIGFYYLLNIKRNNKLENAAYSGFFFSLAGAIDINFFLFIPFMIILFFRRSVKAGLIFGVSCIPVIILYLFLNLFTSGSFMPPAMNAPLWNYPGSEFNQENLSGLANHNNIISLLIYAFHMLIGNRGLISHSPIILFSLISFFVIYKENIQFPYKREYGYILLASLLYIIIYIFKTTNYSGWAFGVRWFTSVMFILCLPIVFLENKIKSSKTMKSLFIYIAYLSIFISIVGVYNPASTLNGTDAEEILSPTNSFSSNLNQIFSDFTINISSSSLLKNLFLSMIPITRLILGASIIYFLLWRFIQNLELASSRRKKQSHL